MSNELIARPDFLPAKSSSAVGTELLTQYVVPPRLKIVQPQSDADLKANFPEGSIILSPQNVIIPAPFNFTPIFFYPEWITWNPRGMKAILPAIRYRTMDENDPVVAKCRNPQMWSEPCPEDTTGNSKNNIRHCEHLNFILMIHDIELVRDTPVVVSFSRSEHASGAAFITLLKMRNADIFGCRFDAILNHRKNNEGNWYGLDIRNPSESKPWVDDQQMFQTYAALYQEYADAHAKRTLQVDYTDGENGSTVGETSTVAGEM